MSYLNLSGNWKKHLKSEFTKEYMRDLDAFLLDCKNKVYPKNEDVFNAFRLTPFEKVKVVIVGQDPYHGEGQAHGLSFSVLPGNKIPPSLRNIYKELNSDLGIEIPKTGFLRPWSKQGVLLLNSVLTVEESSPASHQKKGWEIFTDKVIELLNNEREGIVFILWGNYAKEKGKNISRKKHLVIESAHPSPFAARRGFFGSRPFSKANKYLTKNGLIEIDWSLK